MKRDVRILVLNLSGMGMGEEMALEVMTFHRSMEKVFPVFFGCVIFTAMGVFSVKVVYDKYGSGDFRLFICAACTMLFGVGVIFIIIKLFDRRPVLKLLDVGLFAPKINPEPISWQDILEVRLVTYKDVSFVELILSPSAKASLPSTKTKRFLGSDFLRSVNRALGFNYDGVFLDTAGLELPADQIANLLVERIEHSRSNGPIHS